MPRRLIPVAVTASLLAASPAAGAGPTTPRVDPGPGWDARAQTRPAGADAGAPARAARPVAWWRGLGELRGDSTRRVVVRAGGGDEPASFVSARVPFARFTAADGAVARAEAFFAEYGEAFGVSAPETQLELVEVTRDALGMTHLRFAQRHRGLPVVGRGLAVHLGAGAVTAANGEFAPGLAVDTAPALTAADAQRIARLVVSGAPAAAGAPALVVNVDEAGEARLAWRVALRTERPVGDWRVLVDARDGIVLDRWNRIHDVRRVTTLDARNSYVAQLVLRSDIGDPADPAYQPSAPSGDPIADVTHTNALAVYDYFHDVLGWDTAEPGFPVRAVVHVGRGFANAYWDGDRMYFGDGAGCFRAFGRGLDIVAHEFTHGVIESTSGLLYSGDSGALNESYADVMGAMVDGHNWTIGERITDRCARGPFRDLADPSRLGQPEHLSGYVDTPFDNRGVHTNSGIPNRAAYLTAQAIGREKTAQIYYRAMTADYLAPGADFAANRAALVHAATELYPGGPEAAAVASAQDAVGVADAPRRATRLAGVLPRADRVLRGGETVTITGRLLDDATGLGIAGRRVDIQTSGGTFMSSRTGADGRWQLRLPRPIPYNISWRAIFRGGGGLDAATATTRHVVLIRPKLTAYTDLPRRGGHYRVRSGVRFQLMGASAPRMGGAVVTTQYRWSQRARWRVLGRAYVRQNGRFGGSLRLTGAGSTLWVRHVYDGGRRSGWLDGRSPTIAIDVR